MTSLIDPTKPTEVKAYTADVRANFAVAAGEISNLQARVATLEGAAMGHETPWIPIGFTQVSCNASTPLPAVPDAVRAVVIAEGDNLRFRDDGAAPTPTFGMPLLNGQSYEVLGAAALAIIRFIGMSGTGALINVSYYK